MKKPADERVTHKGAGFCACEGRSAARTGVRRRWANRVDTEYDVRQLRPWYSQRPKGWQKPWRKTPPPRKGVGNTHAGQPVSLLWSSTSVTRIDGQQNATFPRFCDRHYCYIIIVTLSCYRQRSSEGRPWCNVRVVRRAVRGHVIALPHVPRPHDCFFCCDRVMLYACRSSCAAMAGVVLSPTPYAVTVNFNHHSSKVRWKKTDFNRSQIMIPSK